VAYCGTASCVQTQNTQGGFEYCCVSSEQACQGLNGCTNDLDCGCTNEDTNCPSRCVVNGGPCPASVCTPLCYDRGDQPFVHWTCCVGPTACVPGGSYYEHIVPNATIAQADRNNCAANGGNWIEGRCPNPVCTLGGTCCPGLPASCCTSGPLGAFDADLDGQQAQCSVGPWLAGRCPYYASNECGSNCSAW
jgi:hypothetical protein